MNIYNSLDSILEKEEKIVETFENYRRGLINITQIYNFIEKFSDNEIITLQILMYSGRDNDFDKYDNLNDFIKSYILNLKFDVPEYFNREIEISTIASKNPQLLPDHFKTGFKNIKTFVN